MAIRLRDDLRLGRDSISSPIELLESQGVRIVEIDADEKFDGTSTMAGNVPVIVLNKAMIPERKRMTLFHELGHLLLHFPEDADKEKLCNVFANEVLIPSDVFMAMVGSSRRDISLPELRAIQMGFGVSVDALMVKANQLNIISASRLLGYYKKKNKVPNFKTEVQLSRYCNDEQSTRFNRLVFMALANELISFSKAASLLGKSIDEVRNELNLL